MENKNNNVRVLSAEEVESLPIINLEQLPGHIDHGGFILDQQGKVVGKTPLFVPIEGISYVDFYPQAVAVEQKDDNDDEWKRNFSILRKETSFELAQNLIQQYSIKTIGHKRERDIYIYADGIYVLGENTIRRAIQEILEELATTQAKSEIIACIKDATVIDRNEFNVERKFINLRNGVLNIQTLELHPHDPKYLFMYKIPASYIVDADCPNIKKFLREVLMEQDIAVMQEWIGYILYRSYFIKKAMILVGERDTGKSTLLKLMSKFIGKENISGVSLQRLASDKFATAHLYNKHVNIFDDLSFKDINDNGAFKIAAGGGIITGEYKFGDQFQFENYSKLVFACNKIPSVKDSSDEAYFSRWIVIQFNKSVTNPDKFLIERISSEQEMSGLLNFALEGLARLLTNQAFSYQKTPDEIKVEMMRSGSAMANFAFDCMEEANGEWISKQGLYEAFVSYAQLNGLPAGTMNDFGKKILNFATYMSDGKKVGIDPATLNNKQITGWWNVRIKTSNDSLDEQDIMDSIDF